MSTAQPIPTGAVRYNTDSNKMEVYIGDTWMQVAVSSPDLGNSAAGVRGVHNLGNFSTPINTLEFLTISSQGNSTDFGDSTTIGVGGCSPSSRTRGLFAGKNAGAPGYASLNNIDYITFSSTGNAQDFGDLSDPHDYGRNNISSGTRAVSYTHLTLPTILLV